MHSEESRPQVETQKEDKTTMKSILTILLLSSLQFSGIASYCDLTRYRGSAFMAGGRSARVHTGFLRNLQDINRYAKQCKVQIYITSSYRSSRRVNGAIVPPARRSNHLIGHAIDMNVNLPAIRKFCNSRCLRRSSRPYQVTCFINKIRSDRNLRWGGDFRRPDPVHIDDKTNINRPYLWRRLYKSLQNNC